MTESGQVSDALRLTIGSLLGRAVDDVSALRGASPAMSINCRNALTPSPQNTGVADSWAERRSHHADSAAAMYKRPGSTRLS